MSRWTLLFLLLCCVSFFACKEQKTRRLIDEFLLSEIVIPSGIDELLAGNDTPFVSTTDSLARMVIYTDSLSCSSCRLQSLYEYNDILDFYEETDNLFEPVFLFSPRKEQVREVENILRIYRFDFPVFIDAEGLFLEANPHIPADHRFHTFLIDKHGKVVLVGDPVHNPQLWKLYKATITKLINNKGTK